MTTGTVPRPSLLTTVGTATGPTGRAVLRSARGPLLAGLAVALLALILALATASPGTGVLDPDTYDDAGGHALATLLGEHGVTVRRVTDPGQLTDLATADSTVFVPLPEEEPPSVGSILARSPATVVLSGSRGAVLAQLPLLAAPVGDAPVEKRDPGCPLPAALAAGSVRLGGLAFSLPPGEGTGCYPAAGGSTLVQDRTARITVLGSTEALTNAHLGEAGDAALGLNLLDRRPRLIWLLPRPTPRPPRGASVTSFLPHWLTSAALQLAVVVLVVAAWRSRALGRVVREPLPVIVRAAETVEGRGRLYRAASARPRAAEALRAGARDRLAHRLGLGPAPTPAVLVATVGARVTGGPLRAERLLYGAPPVDDRSLVLLAKELDLLTREVAGS